jgi:hypothetical protein
MPDMNTSLFQHLKLEIVAMTGLTKDALHIYVGLIVFLVAAAVVREGMRSKVPVLAVLVIALLGELLDARDDFRELGHWRIWASAHDILNTMFWPVALWLLARYSRVMKA